MKIGIDMDGVLLDTYRVWLEAFNKDHKSNYRFKALDSLRFAECIDVDKKEVKRHLLDFVYNNDPPFYEGAIEALKELEKEHELFIITARGDKVVERTKQILQSSGISFSGVYFALSDYYLTPNGRKTKQEICQQVGCDIFIEDDPQFFDGMDIPVLVFDQPWNRKCILTSNCTRVLGWSEILKNVKKISPLQCHKEPLRQR